MHRSIPLSCILDAIDIASDDDSEDDRSLPEPSQPQGQKNEHTFRVITPKRTFVLCAPTEEDEIKWLAALRALLNRERGTQPLPAPAQANQPLNVPVITQQPPSPAALTDTPVAAAPSIGYTRTRSATQSAKSAVADVVKRYHPEGSS